MKNIVSCAMLLAILMAAIICPKCASIEPETHATPDSIILHFPDGKAVYGETVSPTERPAETPAEAPTETPTGTPAETPTAPADTPTAPADTPTPEPTFDPEPENVAPKLYFLATAYSSDPAENGGFGAVDCLYGRDLPENAIAADLNVLPYGTRVYIDGIGERIVVDTAGKDTLDNMRTWAASKNCEGWIDLYAGDDKAWMHDWGVRVVTLTILEWGNGK